MGDLEAVKQILDNSPGLAGYKWQEWNNRTALYLASMHGHGQIVNLLLQYNSGLNAKCGFFEDTPLHIASQQNKLSIVQTLV